MNKDRLVRNFYVLPCCLLLLNLVVGVVSYKAQLIEDTMLRTAAIIGTVLFGASIVGFVLAPALQGLIHLLHSRSRRAAGLLGEFIFLGILGVFVFWLYFRMYVLGPQSILPPSWRN